jgi:hypothetical protein
MSDKITTQSVQSMDNLSSVLHDICKDLQERFPGLTTVDKFMIAKKRSESRNSHRIMNLSKSGSLAFVYNDKLVMVVDRLYLQLTKKDDPKSSKTTPGDSPKKQAWVWDVLRSYQKDVSILSFMSGDINELGELFQYKVPDFDTFYYQDNSIYLQKEFSYDEITAIVKPALMRILLVEALLSDKAQKITNNFTTGDLIDLFSE